MDKSSMQIIVFFAMVVFVAVYVTITNNKRKQNAIINKLKMDGENQHKESILVMITNVYHITLKEMPMRIL